MIKKWYDNFKRDRAARKEFNRTHSGRLTYNQYKLLNKLISNVTGENKEDAQANHYRKFFKVVEGGKEK